MKKYFRKYLYLSLTILISMFLAQDLFSLLLDLSKGETLLAQIFRSHALQVALLLLVLFTVGYFFGNCLRRQKIRNQPSWVYFLFWGILWVLILLIYPKLQLFFSFFSLWENHCASLAICLLFILLGNLCYRKIKPKEFDRNFRFSPNSVGLEQDLLQYKISAKNEAQGIFLLSDYVNVVALHGGSGYGKSSYTRMIIESLEKDRILYAYISLTETNEAKGFSNLFSERWNETLTARYPKLLVAEYFPLMRLIFRETGQNILFEIMNYLSTFDCGLFKTKTKICDKRITNKDDFATAEIAKLFGNVVEFKEDFWIIVIDEIERSPVAETYRVIEMIERFRAEGRNGLPIKMVFFICIGDDFDGLLKIKENEELRYLISNFVDSPKSISRHSFLPPLSNSQKKDFIFGLIYEFKKKNGIKGAPENREDVEWGYFDPINKALLTEDESIKFTVDVLQEESPRLINTCLFEAQFFYNSFKNIEGIERKDAICFSDILLASYIRAKFKDLMIFLVKTGPELYRQSQSDLDAKDLYERMIFEKEKDGNVKTEHKLMKWMARVLEVPEDKYPDWEKKNIFKATLVAAVSHSYVDRVNGIYEPESGFTYDRRLSDPTRLMEYLASVSEFVVDTKKQFISMYHRHQDVKLKLSETSNEELVGYSRFLRDIKKTKTSLNLDVTNELSKRIIDNSIKLIPGQVERDYIRNEAVYQFSFQLVETLEQQRNKENLKEETKQAINLFINFLSSDSVDTGSKFVILSSFVNQERGGGSDIHNRLQRAFEIMNRFNGDEIRAAIRHVFEEVDKRYLSGSEIIYEKEDNFFYVLYQSWSGKKDNTIELQRIHEAAARGLKDNLRAIKLYWSKFPAPAGAETYDEAVDDDYFFGSETREFNITLVKLIEISEQRVNDFNSEERRKIELWKKIINDSKEAEKYYERCSVKDSTDTLASFLIRNGYLVG